MVHLRVVRLHYSRGTAQAAAERDILLAIHFVGDRRSHAGTPGLHLVQDLAFVGADRAEAPVVDRLEHQVARGGRRAATDPAATFDVPVQPLVQRIPRLQAATRVLGRLGTEGRLNGLRRTRRTNVTRGTGLEFYCGLIR